MLELDNTSVAKEYYYIKELMFVPNFGFNPYEDMEFSDSDKIWIDPKTRRVRLKRQVESQRFPITDDIYFRTEVVNPLAAREIEMIQVVSREPRNTSTRVRLYNGSNDYYWDGVTWAIAAVDDWNTEAEVNANFDSFPFLPDRQLAVVVNLVTTDNCYTPEIFEVLVLFKLRIDYIEDLVFRSLIPAIKEEIRPAANLPFPAYTTDVDVIDLTEFSLDTPFDIADIEAVYDFTADNELLYNIFDSYNPTTEVITLSSTLPSGHVPFVIFNYRPKIVYTTNQDYFEVAKVPSIVLQRMEVPLVTEYSLLSREAVIDKGTGRAIIIEEPLRVTFEFRIHVYCDKAVDEARLMSAVLTFFQNNKAIHMLGVDEHYRMELASEVRDLNTPSSDGEHVFWLRFQIIDVKMPLVSREGMGILRLSLIFNGAEDSAEEEFATGHSSIVLHSLRTLGEAPVWNETIVVED